MRLSSSTFGPLYTNPWQRDSVISGSSVVDLFGAVHHCNLKSSDATARQRVRERHRGCSSCRFLCRLFRREELLAHLGGKCADSGIREPGRCCLTQAFPSCIDCHTLNRSSNIFTEVSSEPQLDRCSFIAICLNSGK